MERQAWRLVVALATASAIDAAAAFGPKEIYNPNDFLYLRRDKSEPKNSLFGYSVAFQKRTNQASRVLIGAPIENVDGTIYACELNAEILSTPDKPEFPCKKIKIKSFRVNRRHADLSYNDHYTWLGANIYSEGDAFVVCAPRWSREVMVGNKSYDEVPRAYRYQAFGQCYKVPENQQDYHIEYTNSRTFCNFECLGVNGTAVPTNGGFGWSMTKSHTHLYVGGPAVCTTGAYFKGGTEIVVTAAQHYACPKRRRRIVFPTLNFGYALASGCFFKEGLTGVAVSNPYGEHGRGAVFIRGGPSASQGSLKIMDEQLGSMFGAALCAVRVRKRTDQTYDDLLVGSPLYTNNVEFPERGAVLLYLGGPLLQQNPKPSAIFYGEKEKYRSYFGVSIANLGDMDGDKIDEFAVGAPYEDERGAVYIFGGPIEATSSMVEISYRQRITPGLEGFGISFAPMVDVDRNGCNELAVGATDSELVAVLRCPIRIKILAQPYGSKIHDLQPWNEKVNDTSFKIPSCFLVEPIGNLENTMDAKLLVKTTLNAESGLTLSESDQNYTFTALLNARKMHCQNIIANANDMITIIGDNLPTTSIAEYTNYTMQISLLSGDCFKGIHLSSSEEDTVRYKVSSSEVDKWIPKESTSQCLKFRTYNDKYDRGCVVLDGGSKLQSSVEIMTRVGCDEMCHPNLTTTLEYVGSDSIEAGTAGSVTVRMNVSNAGGSAYGWCARLRLDGATLKPPPAALRCDVDFPPSAVAAAYSCAPLPLLNNTNMVLDMELIAQSLSSKYGEQKAMLNVTVATKCETTDAGRLSYNTLPIRVLVKPQHITIESVDVYPKKNISRAEMTAETVLKTNFSHGYKIRNAGPTTWEGMAMEVVAGDFVFLELGVPQGENIINCTDAKGTISNESKINSPHVVKICFAPIKSNHTFRVTLPLTVLHNKIGSILVHNLTIKTTATLLHQLFKQADSKVAHGSTLLVAVDGAHRVAWWIILLTTLVALAVLGGLIFVMYKCGFFKRKIKKELQVLKRKSSLMQSKRASAAPTARSSLPLYEEMPSTTEVPASTVACAPTTVRTRPMATGLS